MRDTVLVRYGAIPEVARFQPAGGDPIARGSDVVVRTHRGLQLGSLLEDVPPRTNGTLPADADFVIVRPAGIDDRSEAGRLRFACESEYSIWSRRIDEWNLELELLDIERTLDGEKLILYVLSGRGPDCTKLALQAAAAGLGLIEVQPVDAEGVVQLQASGGCGSGGCGCHDV